MVRDHCLSPPSEAVCSSAFQELGEVGEGGERGGRREERREDTVVFLPSLPSPLDDSPPKPPPNTRACLPPPPPSLPRLPRPPRFHPLRALHLLPTQPLFTGIGQKTQKKPPPLTVTVTNTGDAVNDSSAGGTSRQASNHARTHAHVQTLTNTPLVPLCAPSTRAGKADLLSSRELLDLPQRAGLSHQAPPHLTHHPLQRRQLVRAQRPRDAAVAQEGRERGNEGK